MASFERSLERPPEARIETVEDLVSAARRGRLRVPDFQRGLKWRSDDVCALFESIHRGLPIGSLLVWRHHAPAARVALGPLIVDAEEVADGWWVIDGQQRLISLTASLARSWPPPPDAHDPFIVYFDPIEGRFTPPAKRGVPSEWVPLPALFDSSELAEWTLGWAHGQDADLRRRVFDAGKRIREYRVPLYVVDTDDKAVLSDIFFAVNKRGRPLTWPEVHDALFGNSGTEPTTIRQLSGALAELGMGKIDSGQLTSCLLAARGLDVTRTLSSHVDRDRDILRGAAKEALPSLRRALVFLRAHASIPHLRLLPRAWVLEALTRFFVRHSEPRARSLDLLTRWTWRALLAGGGHAEKTLRRRAVAAIGVDEEASLQALLALVPRERVSLIAPQKFDHRAADSRFRLLALASLGPRHLADGSVIDVAALLEAEDANAFQMVSKSREAMLGASANRILHPPTRDLAKLMCARASPSPDNAQILSSHAVSLEATQALRTREDARFVRLRSESVESALSALADRCCGWSRGDRDRPSLKFLLERQSA